MPVFHEFIRPVAEAMKGKETPEARIEAAKKAINDNSTKFLGPLKDLVEVSKGATSLHFDILMEKVENAGINDRISEEKDNLNKSVPIYKVIGELLRSDIAELVPSEYKGDFIAALVTQLAHDRSFQVALKMNGINAAMIHNAMQ